MPEFIISKCYKFGCIFMKVVPIETASGLIKKPTDRRQSIENAELRIALEQAVDVAGLNLTEKLALNKEFFPKGDGFKITPLEEDVIEITTYYKKDEAEFDDFAEEAMKIAIENGNGLIKETVKKSKKGNFQTNLDNALAKMYDVLKSSR